MDSNVSLTDLFLMFLIVILTVCVELQRRQINDLHKLILLVDGKEDDFDG